MRAIPIIALLGVFCIAAASETAGQEKPQETRQGVKVVADAEGRSSVTPKEHYLIRVKTRSAVDVTGTVMRIDRAGKSLTLKGKGKTITFDMINPSLIGYTTLDEIKTGNTVTVSYVKDGLQIRKGLPPAPPQVKTAKVKPAAPSVSEQKRVERKTVVARTTPVRFRDKPRSTEFRDVDNNKDGKVSAVELTVMIPDLTLKQFREYDTNGDGYLDEAEFRAMKRSR